MNKKAIRELFEELLTDYEIAEGTVNGEYSTDCIASEARLAQELADWRMRIDEVLEEEGDDVTAEG